MTKQDFLEGMTILGVAYDKEFTEEQVSVWYQMLGNYTKQEFKSAIQELIKTEEYLPSIAKITKTIAKTKVNLPDAEDEWQDVLRAVRQYGSWDEKGALESLEPYTRKIVQYIGFNRICMATPEEQVWNKKEFIGEYNSLKDKVVEHTQLGVSEIKLLNE